MRTREFTVTLNILLVFAWARFRPAHMFNWRLHCQRSMLRTQHRLRLTMQHVYGHTGNLGDECADHLASSPVTTLPLAGFVTTSTHLLVVMVVTASARFWKTEATSPRMGEGAVFIIGFFVSLTHALVSLAILLSALFPHASNLLFRKSDGKPNFVCLYRVEFW